MTFWLAVPGPTGWRGARAAGTGRSMTMQRPVSGWTWPLRASTPELRWAMFSSASRTCPGPASATPCWATRRQTGYLARPGQIISTAAAERIRWRAGRATTRLWAGRGRMRWTAALAIGIWRPTGRRRRACGRCCWPLRGTPGMRRGIPMSASRTWAARGSLTSWAATTGRTRSSAATAMTISTASAAMTRSMAAMAMTG